jgi:hypothetical protein
MKEFNQILDNLQIFIARLLKDLYYCYCTWHAISILAARSDVVAFKALAANYGKFRRLAAR